MAKPRVTASEQPAKRTRRRVGRKVGKSNITIPSLETLVSAEDDERIKDLMIACAEHNETMNAHKKAYEANRKELLKLLNELNQETYTHKMAEVNGRKVALEATVATPSKRAVDVEKFKGFVSPEQFVEAVTIAVGTAEKIAGANIVNQCTYDAKGSENVTVKARARD